MPEAGTEEKDLSDMRARNEIIKGPYPMTHGHRTEHVPHASECDLYLELAALTDEFISADPERKEEIGKYIASHITGKVIDFESGKIRDADT